MVAYETLNCRCDILSFTVRLSVLHDGMHESGESKRGEYAEAGASRVGIDIVLWQPGHQQWSCWYNDGGGWCVLVQSRPKNSSIVIFAIQIMVKHTSFDHGRDRTAKVTDTILLLMVSYFKSHYG